MSVILVAVFVLIMVDNRIFHWFVVSCCREDCSGAWNSWFSDQFV